MYGADKKPDVIVEIGDGVAVIRRKGISRPIVANILKCEHDKNEAIKYMILDRLVHHPHETNFSGWHVTGAFVSVLELLPS